MARIFIEPGHYEDNDTGIYKNGIRESDVALNISRQIAEELIERGHDVKVQGDNNFACLNWKSDICISIHTNHSENPKQRGIETYYWPGDRTSKSIAQEIGNYLQDLIGFPFDCARTSTFGTLQRALCPAVLVGVGYITNQEDAAYISSEHGSAVIASSIANTVDYCFSYQRLGT